MSENKTEKQSEKMDKTAGRHQKRAEERRDRQAEALRANLKRRKDQVRQRNAPADKNT
jgi:hypothetical protein